MQIFAVIVLLTSLYYAPAIYKKIINNLKVGIIHLVMLFSDAEHDLFF